MLLVFAIRFEFYVNILGKKALSKDKEVIYFYFFLTAVWLFRACLASFIEPWPLQPTPAAAIGQLIAYDVLAFLMIIVSISFIWELKKVLNKH